ncbi:MAG: enoyl-CoA hydratase [Gammaproteobacteria bacterium]|nr:MAG: enoyl-CoA hydratase [Gammaproteobacteria bacterium]
MTTYQTLTLAITDGIGQITLNRPEQANGIDMAMGRELMMAAIECDESPAVRAVLLTANGKFFSAGGDLKSFAAMGDQIGAGIKELTTYLHAAISRFARMDAPVVVAVNGVAAGAGMSLALCGDQVIAARSAKFSMAYTAAALSPDGGATWLLPRLVGLQRARELMLLNRRLSAEEALGWGMLTRVVDDEQLAADALALASQLAQGPTGAYGEVKRLLADTFDNGLEAQMELEARAIAMLSQSPDGQEGINAFLEKRKAQFRG